MKINETGVESKYADAVTDAHTDTEKKLVEIQLTQLKVEHNLTFVEIATTRPPEYSGTPQNWTSGGS